MDREDDPPPVPEPRPGPSPEALAARKRVLGFGTHLIGYFAVMIMVTALNFWFTPENLWFIWPMVGWGPVLALHAAYAMGLFGIFKD